ncbi:MAG TPA: RNA polymerase factor sigma-54, partial [Chromatiales bacterium]|nr:RNA polymerase factor sigma-54 [Chromatiales bacterium]
MKQSIQLRLGQHLAMTPQLQQAIRLLQMSTMELQLEIQRTLESNLMLESGDEAEDEAPTPGNGAAEGAMESRNEAATEVEAGGTRDSIPDELPVDSVWEDIYDIPTPYSGPGDDNSREMEILGGGGETLREHLLWQMNLTPFSDIDLAVAMAIIDAINEDGYLSLPLEEIHQGLPASLQIDFEEVETVLHRIRNFDPVGSGARTLSECLSAQLQQFDPDKTPALASAREIVARHLDALGRRDYGKIMRKLKIGEEEMELAAALIRSLNPRPGSQIAGPPPAYIVPDVFVRKYRGA